MHKGKRRKTGRSKSSLAGVDDANAMRGALLNGSLTGICISIKLIVHHRKIVLHLEKTLRTLFFTDFAGNTSDFTDLLDFRTPVAGTAHDGD